MALLDLTSLYPVPGALADANQLKSALDAIKAVVNNLDGANFNNFTDLVVRNLNAAASVSSGGQVAGTAASGQRAFSASTAAGTDWAFASQVVTTDSVVRFGFDGNGQHSWGPGGGTVVDTVLYRAGIATLKTDGGFIAAGGLATKTKAGIPVDGDLVATMQVSGACVLDTTNSRIYFRVGATWKFAALT